MTQQPVFLERFDDLPWRSSRDFATTVAKEHYDKGEFQTGKVADEYFENWKYKVLRVDEKTKGVTRLNWHGPAVNEPNVGYHLYSEEWFRISGEGLTADLSYPGGTEMLVDRAWCYTFRPPGWAHGGKTVSDSMGLLWNDGPVTHVVTDKAFSGKNVLYPNDPVKALGSRGYIRTRTNLMQWIPMNKYPRISFGSKKQNLSDISYRILSVDSVAEAQTLMLKFEPSFNQENWGKLGSDVEFFVLEGDLSIGDKTFSKYGYAFLPQGYDIENIRSKEGSVLYFKADGPISFNR